MYISIKDYLYIETENSIITIVQMVVDKMFCVKSYLNNN